MKGQGHNLVGNAKVGKNKVAEIGEDADPNYLNPYIS